MRYRPDLDGIRALAVLAVLISHAEFPLTRGGWLGVDVFFVLSGYLITALLLSEQGQAGRVALRRFYARRALRLYPALLAVLLVGAIFYRDLGAKGTLAGYGQTAAAAGLYVEDFVAGFAHGAPDGGFGYTWSLAIEEQFYLLWPPLLAWLLLRGRSPLRWAAVGTLASWTLLIIDVHRSDSDHAYFLPWDRFSQLLLGCCVAVILARRPAPDWFSRRAVGWGLAATAACLLVAADRLARSIHLGWQAPAIALLTAAVILHLHGATGGVRTVLGSRPLAYLGRRSYGIYLIHVPVLIVLGAHTHMRRTELAAVMMVLTISLALLSYRFVELPFLRLKHRRFEPPSHPPEPVPT